MFHRRFFPRQTISLPAWIEVNSSRLLERCKLMDLSESGARLGITDVRNLPPQFNLYLARIGQSAHQCRIIWQRGNEVGVDLSLQNGPRMPQSPTSLRSCLHCRLTRRNVIHGMTALRKLKPKNRTNHVKAKQILAY